MSGGQREIMDHERPGAVTGQPARAQVVGGRREMGKPWEAICALVGVRGLVGPLHVPDGRVAEVFHTGFLAVISGILLWCLPVARPLFPSCHIVIHPCSSGGVDPLFSCDFLSCAPQEPL